MKRLHIPKQYINALVMGDAGLVGASWFGSFEMSLLDEPLSLRFKQEEFCDGDKAHRKTLRDHRFRRLRHHS
jgi:hypothetical protein